MTAPRNAQEAMQQANRNERAKQLIIEGYSFTQDKDTDVIAVCKPGRLAASYWIVDGECDCPDRMKGNICKHELAWGILQAEQADEAKMWESICARYDEDEGYLDRIPTPTLMSLAMKDLTTRMEADLQSVQQDIAAQSERRTGYIHCQYQHQRAGRLENAIETVNQYREVPATSVYTRPADVPPHQFCTVCGVANLHGPRCFADDCPNRITN